MIGLKILVHILEIKKIYQHIVNNVNLPVLKLEKCYLHQNGVEFHWKLIGNQLRGVCRQKKTYPVILFLSILGFGLIVVGSPTVGWQYFGTC